MAREEISPLRSSVFMTPVRQALLAEPHASADSVNRRLTRKGVSIQVFGVKTKPLEVDLFVQQGGHRIIEVYPEVSFARLALRALTTRKYAWAGMQHRRMLLESVGIDLDQESPAPGPGSTTVGRGSGRVDGASICRG